MNQMIKTSTPAMRVVIEAQLTRSLTAGEERGVGAAFERRVQHVYPHALFEKQTAVLALRPRLLDESERVVRSRQPQFSEHLRGELAREFRR